VAGAASAAGDDLPAGDPDVHVGRAADLRRDRGHGIVDGERGADRALGLVAVRQRRAEHGHDAVAEVLVDPAAVLLDDAVDPLEEAAEQRVHVLGVELPAQRGVAGEIGEEHHDLAPLAHRLVVLGVTGGHLVRFGGAAQRRDRVEQPAAVADRGHA
jgi:hypothetical protein